MFIRRVIDDKYKPYKDVFRRLMDLIEVLCHKDYKSTYENLLKPIKFIKLISPLILDSDDLAKEIIKFEDKVIVIRALFDLLE